MPTYWFDATDSNEHPEDASDLYDDPDADALADADKVRPVTVAEGAEQETDDDDFESDAAAVEAGVCPWCPSEDRYEGDHVGRHASSAHPDAWDAFKSDA